MTVSLISEYRVHRLTPPVEERSVRKPMELRGRARLKPPRTWKRPSRSALHSEIACLRQVLKTANRKGWIPGLPDMSAPYKASGSCPTEWCSCGVVIATISGRAGSVRSPLRAS